MNKQGEIGAAPRQARRSRLFRGRPDALLVEEWVPNITLPPPPEAPLEEENEAEVQLDEHGLPQFQEEPEAEIEERAGPARLFVGMGQRGAPVAPSPDSDDGDDEYVYQETDDFFVAELRLPRPEDSLPFRIGASAEPEEQDDYLLDAAEASDPDIAYPELESPFSVTLEAPDPIHLGSFGDAEGAGDDDDDDGEYESEPTSEEDRLEAGEDEDDYDDYEDLSGSEDSDGALDDLVSGGLPPLTLQPSPARVPLSVRSEDQPEPAVSKTPVSRPVEMGVPDWAAPRRAEPPPPAEPAPAKPALAKPAPAEPTGPSGERPKATVVLRSRPFWTKDRRMPEPKPASAPVFQPREVPQPPPIREKLFSWPTMGVLLGLLLIAAILLVVQLAS